MGGTLVLNACGTLLASVSWQRAVVMVLNGVAEVFEEDPERRIRSKDLELPYPKVVRLVRWVYVRYTETGPRRDARPSKRAVLVRDKYSCAYCGQTGADTVDHVVPVSRGGLSTWENLVAACKPCNQRKADRPLERCGMKLLWEPYKPDTTTAQRSVWKALSTV